MPAFFLQSSQFAGAVTVDTGGLDELRADFGPTEALTIAKLQTFVANPDHRALGYRTSGTTVRGVLLAVRTILPDDLLAILPPAPSWWEIVRTVVQKSLSDAQRVQGFQEMTRFVANQFPQIGITGVVKANGKLDTFLTPKGYTRTVFAQKPGPSTIVTDPDTGISTGEQTYIPTLVRHSALASVVAATI